ncbi:MAG TPA: hypothetical protein VL986_07170 [Terracidiphilus sp.]|nr:hypothetical protein [Terracidiphilus sp.]
MNGRKSLGVLLLAVSLVSAQAQSGQGSSDAKPAKAKHKTQQQLEQELDELSDKYELLEQQMQQMKVDAQKRDQELEEAVGRAKVAQSDIEKAAQQERVRIEQEQIAETKQGEAVNALESAVTDLKTNSASLADTIQTDQKASQEPSAIRFMGISLKPGGFLAGETVDRQRGTGGDVNTQFSGIPFSGQTSGQLSEFNASARQSRVSLLAEGKLPATTLRGYFEGDFLSAGVTSNDNQSNSYTFRVRQAWGQAASPSWIFTAGQMWSLATEYKSGLVNGSEQIPLTIDSQYQVGFTWERQYGARVVKNLGKMSAGFAVEEAQTLNLGGHNLPALVYQQAGNSGGLYNPTANYSFNFVPDLVGKLAFDPGFGHFEVFSVGRFFRARAFPDAAPMLTTTPWGPTSPSTLGAFTTKSAGGGLGLNAWVPMFGKRFEIGLHGLAGDGMGRYTSSTLPDATARPNGTLELLSGGSALGSLQWHALRRLDLYGYYGGEYDKRAFYNTGAVVTTAPTTPYQPPLGQPILGGYGAPTNIEWGCNLEVVPAASANGGGDVSGSALGCTADNRNIQEGTFGYWFRIYRGPRGTFQQGFQYSYVVRHTWLGVGLPGNPTAGTAAIPGSPEAIDNMFFTSFRYYLP